MTFCFIYPFPDYVQERNNHHPPVGSRRVSTAICRLFSTGFNSYNYDSFLLHKIMSSSFISIQVINQDRLLSEIRDDDAILIQKVAQLELQLRKKACRTIATQTEVQSQQPNNSSRAVPPYNPPPAVSRQQLWEDSADHFGPFSGYHSPPPDREYFNHSTPIKPKNENKIPWNSQVIKLRYLSISKVSLRIYFAAGPFVRNAPDTTDAAVGHETASSLLCCQDAE